MVGNKGSTTPSVEHKWSVNKWRGSGLYSESLAGQQKWVHCLITAAIDTANRLRRMIVKKRLVKKEKKEEKQ